jgi:hypothetical protein
MKHTRIICYYCRKIPTFETRISSEVSSIDLVCDCGTVVGFDISSPDKSK